MTIADIPWVMLLSCVGQLALVSLLVGRGRQSPLVRPLALMCLDFFAFNAADLASQFSAARGWNLLDATAASLLMPIVIEFFLVFTGRRRALAWLLWATRIAFGGVARRVAEAHSGRATIESHAGAGTIVAISLRTPAS